MAEQQFAIVFRGRLMAGADPAQVRANFAKLFNIEAARVEQMFAGQPVIIKKGLDLLSADKYKAALAKAGAVVDAIDMPAEGAANLPPPAAVVAAVATPLPSTASPVTPPHAAPTPAAASTAALSVDPAHARSAPPAALRGTPNALNTTLAEPGAQLVEPRPLVPATIATEHLSMAQAGVRIVDYTPPPAPLYELGDLSLAEPGVLLTTHQPKPTPQFDLSALSLDDAARL